MNKPRPRKPGKPVRMWRFPNGVLRPIVGSAPKKGYTPSGVWAAIPLARWPCAIAQKLIAALTAMDSLVAAADAAM
jgi:hypothetical protein